MRVIKKNGIKLSDLFKIREFSINGKIIKISTSLQPNMLKKINNKEIVIQYKENNNIIETLREIIYEQVINKEILDLTDLESLNERVLYRIICEIKKDNKHIFDKYVNKNIKNPLEQFVEMISKNSNKILEIVIQERIKSKNIVNSFNENIRHLIYDTGKKVLDYVYEYNNVPKKLRDYSKEKIFKAIDFIMSINKYSIDECEYKQVLEKYGWFVNLELSDEEKEKIIKLKGDKDSIDHYILSIVDNNLVDEMVNLWIETGLLSRRIHIIKKCIQSLKEENYELFIPVMLMQLEGVIIDVYNLKGKYTLRDEFMKLLKELTRRKDNDFNKNAEELYTKIILSGFEVGRKSESLSRHAILHGYEVNYGTKVNTFKLLFYFDHVCRNLYLSSIEVNEFK
ncbi:hypothetical protein [Caminicella sporogenes]|uniref:hypothetical protein n=1 Tax=Caminicella sporogenes TaxID=166485 RepID=UPI00254092CD|nr:hypothetical protein [Caminicella sporogenes]WIF95474.1 hypothetical protein QNI18_02190 [Caminicella sporogenes]